MKQLLYIFLLASTLGSCKKIIDKQKENFVLSVMTEGQWIISRFVDGNDTITHQFSPYTFQFNRDYTVDAINGGTIENKGNWQGDPETMNISANFPDGHQTLTQLNGTWHIDKNTLSSVIASQSGQGVEKSLRLDKK